MRLLVDDCLSWRPRIRNLIQDKPKIFLALFGLLLLAWRAWNTTTRDPTASAQLPLLIIKLHLPLHSTKRGLCLREHIMVIRTTIQVMRYFLSRNVNSARCPLHRHYHTTILPPNGSIQATSLVPRTGIMALFTRHQDQITLLCLGTLLRALMYPGFQVKTTNPGVGLLPVSLEFLWWGQSFGGGIGSECKLCQVIKVDSFPNLNTA